MKSAGRTDGVAALLSDNTSGGVSWLPAVVGKVYATMPLPLNASGLPVHLNGGFWMQADRRKLWSGEGDRGKVSHTCCPAPWCLANVGCLGMLLCF